MPAREPTVQEQQIRLIYYKTSNTSILKHNQAEYAPCLRDMYLNPLQPSNAFEKTKDFLDKHLWDKLARPETFRQDLHQALYETQLVPNLPCRTNLSAHVYVVTVPHIPLEVSRHHWSVYSQGHFYHLSARVPKNPTKQSGTSGLEKKVTRAPLVLKVENLSTTESADYIKNAREASRKAFVAYEMGSTQYGPEQLRSLAQYIITALRTYDLLHANCQVFTTSLIERVVMTKRDCSVFVGSKTQLVDWDLRARQNNDETAHHPYNLEHGYLIRKPRIRPGWSFRTRRPFYVLFPISGTKLKAIHRLYAEGPFAGYSPVMDPTGKHSLLTYPLFQLRENWAHQRRFLWIFSREFGEDLVSGRWGDAFRGREETHKAYVPS